MPSLDNAAVVLPPEEELWYVAIDDETVGPLRLAEVEQRAHDGELDLEQLVWAEGMSDWLPIADVPRLAALLPEAPAEPDASTLPAPIEWRPQAAADLSALVEQVELEPEPEDDEAEDPFADLPPMTFIAPTPAAASWGVPQPEPQPATTSRAPIIIFAALTLVGCVAGVLVGLQLAGDDPAEAPEASNASLRVAPEPVVPTPPKPPEEVEEATELVLTPPPAPTPTVEPPKKDPRRPRRRRPPPPAEPQITKKQIAEAVYAQRGSLGPCIRNAIDARELAPGTYSLVASWVIGPRGKLLEPKLIGPPQVLRTSLPACAARVMREWTFPAPGIKAPVSRFPLANARVRPR